MINVRYAIVAALLAVLPCPVFAQSAVSINGGTQNKAPAGTTANPLVTTAGAPSGTSGVPNQTSTDSVSNKVFTAPNNLLFSLTVKIGATSGYVMLFDAASLPANGAVSPKWCYPVASDGTNGSVAAEWATPLSFTTGITAGFSTTGCDSLTASATAKFMGQAS